MKTQTSAEIDYDYANTLYYYTRKNRYVGCEKDKLRKMLALSEIQSENILDKLIARGTVSVTESGPILTEDGWLQVLGTRRDKTHATVCFTSALELRAEREASVYRFDYTLRDNAFRQSSQSLTISISNQLSRVWKMRRMDESVNDPKLINVLRRYAFDYISSRLITGDLRVHENLMLGYDSTLHNCRYDANDLPGNEGAEYEVEWSIRGKS